MRVKLIYLLCLFAGVFMTNNAFAQLSAQSRTQLKKEEDSLKKLSFEMINQSVPMRRQEANDRFIPAFVKALKTSYSFSYPFDSLKQISILYNPDSTFRIFTWGLGMSEIQYRFYGAIQMKTNDGNLQLFPLFDDSFDIQNKDTIAEANSWIGALYYNMIETKYRNKIYYTLMGWCGPDIYTEKKVLDILTFKNGKPLFGAPVFKIKNDTVVNSVQNRFFLEYKKESGAGLNYDKNLKMIVYDHLIAINGQKDNPADMVPDGTYSGFKWINGYWMYVDQVFQNEGDVKTPPVPKPFNFKKR